jgi:hypothetical protein
MQVVLPLAFPSSSDEEVKGDEHDIHTVQGELAVARQSLWDGCREVEWLKECLVVAETALGATKGEAANARATNVVTYTELISELNFSASFVGLFFVLILTLRVS